MRAGTRAKVHGLVKASQYNDRTGEMVGLDVDTGRYWVLFDDTKEKMKVKRTNIRAIVHEETVSEDSLGGLLDVNGLCYCPKHRREVCAVCHVDYRVMNRMAEGIPGGWEIAAAKVEQEKRAKTLAREAPHEAGEADPKPTSGYDKKKLVTSGLDPTTLSLWVRKSKGKTGALEQLREFKKRQSAL